MEHLIFRPDTGDILDDENMIVAYVGIYARARDPSLGAKFAASLDLLAAAKLQEAAEHRHANCEECEGLGVPELCSACFPFFDNARVKRRAAIARAEARP